MKGMNTEKPSDPIAALARIGHAVTISYAPYKGNGSRSFAKTWRVCTATISPPLPRIGPYGRATPSIASDGASDEAALRLVTQHLASHVYSLAAGAEKDAADAREEITHHSAIEAASIARVKALRGE